MRFVLESVVPLLEDLEDVMIEVEPEGWSHFLVLRKNLGLTCLVTKKALEKVFLSCEKDERVVVRLRQLGYPLDS